MKNEANFKSTKWANSHVTSRDGRPAPQAYTFPPFTTLYDILWQFTTFYDILRHFMTIYDILWHFTTFRHFWHFYSGVACISDAVLKTDDTVLFHLCQKVRNIYELFGLCETKAVCLNISRPEIEPAAKLSLQNTKFHISRSARPRCKYKQTKINIDKSWQIYTNLDKCRQI